MVVFNRNIMNRMMMKYMKNVIFIFAILLTFTACERDEYYQDGGKAVAKFNGDMLQYLESKPVPFDTIAQLVKLAGLEETFKNETFTFFAPSDEYIKQTIGTIHTDGLNRRLYNLDKDTVINLSDIHPLIWRKYLQRYMFKDANLLKDYPQIDFGQKLMFPGQLYYAYDKSVFNIGVEFGDANGIKYIGYRSILISYIPDISRPDDNWRTTRVSSSDIQPKNGVVHTLQWDGGNFGFIREEFFDEVINNTN